MLGGSLAWGQYEYKFDNFYYSNQLKINRGLELDFYLKYKNMYILNNLICPEFLGFPP